jgi:hypothetical protein
METLSHRVSLERLNFNGYQKAMEDRQMDLMMLQDLELFSPSSDTLPSNLRGLSLQSSSDSVSSLSSDSLCSPFSPDSEALEQLPPMVRRYSTIMPSPVRLKPCEMMQVWLAVFGVLIYNLWIGACSVCQ